MHSILYFLTAHPLVAFLLKDSISVGCFSVFSVHIQIEIFLQAHDETLLQNLREGEKGSLLEDSNPGYQLQNG